MIHVRRLVGYALVAGWMGVAAANIDGYLAGGDWTALWRGLLFIAFGLGWVIRTERDTDG